MQSGDEKINKIKTVLQEKTRTSNGNKAILGKKRKVLCKNVLREKNLKDKM